MSNMKRRKANSAGMPTVRMTTGSPAYSLNDERRWLRRQRIATALVLTGLLVGVVALAFSWGQFTRGAAPVTEAPRPVAAENIAPAAQPSQAPVALPSAAPVAQPSQAAIVQPVAPAAAAAGTTANCPAINGVPIFDGARCIEHETDLDDGVLETRNTFVADARPDVVQQFFETALIQNGWMLVKTAHDAEDSSWEYTATQGTHRLKLEIEGQQGPNGSFARIKIEHE